MYITGAEPRKCPAEFQDRLTRMFGKNRFGDPNFKIVWGQSQFIRCGNLWKDKDGVERLEYRDRYQCHGQPCWNIMRWKAPEIYGSPGMYYANSYMATRDRTEDPTRPYDSAEGFYVTGEYPWKGRYEIVQPLKHEEVVNGKMLIEYMPLSHYLIDCIIPMIMLFQHMSVEELQAAQALTKEMEDKKENELITDRMLENLPVWMGPVSYGQQGCRTSLLDRKMHAIQQVWNRLSKGGRPHFNKGLAVGDRPSVARYN